MTECFTSSKPTITHYNPSENYVVQLVESLASVDSPSENHIYVIEDTNEKYIYYNGAFSKFEAEPLEPLIVEHSGTYSSSQKGPYQYYYSDHITFDKTYAEVVQAVNEGRPVYLKTSSRLRVVDIDVLSTNVIFSYSSAYRNSDNTQHEIENAVFYLPSSGTTGSATRVKILAHLLVPDTALSSTSTKPVQNKVVKQALNNVYTKAETIENIIHFTQGSPNTADKTYTEALAIHNSGRNLVAYLDTGSISAVSSMYIVSANTIVFYLEIAGIVSGTIVWSNDNTITINVS